MYKIVLALACLFISGQGRRHTRGHRSSDQHLKASGGHFIYRNLLDDQQKTLAMLFLAQAPSSMIRSPRTHYPAGGLAAAGRRPLVATIPGKGPTVALAPNQLRSPPPEMNLVAKGAVAGAVIAAGKMYLKRRADKKREEQAQVLKGQIDRQFDALDFDFGPDVAVAQPTRSQASAVKSDNTAPAKLENEPKIVPVAEDKVVAKPRPKRVINLFNRKPAVVVPTVAELVEGDSPKAILRSALARSLSVPMTLDVVAAVSSNTTSDSDGPAAKSASILSDIDHARKEALGNGLSEADIATCLEEVGRALVIQLVDEALDALKSGGKEAFTNSAVALCHFARNAGTLVNVLGVAGKVKEVTYDGTRRRGQLEKLFRSLLSEAAPALMSSMKGMMDQMEGGDTNSIDDLATDVDFDTIQVLRPVLKITEKAGERMMNKVIQNSMMKSFGSSMFGKDGKGEPDPDQMINMLEEALDSGMMGPDELETMRQQFREQVKKDSNMEVEELLRRKSESNVNQMKPEERKMFTILERLFDENAEPIKTSVDAGAESPFPLEDEMDEEVDDGSIKITVRKDAIEADEVADAEEDSPADAKLTVRIKKKENVEEKEKGEEHSPKDESEGVELVVGDQDPPADPVSITDEGVEPVVGDQDLPPTPSESETVAKPVSITDATA